MESLHALFCQRDAHLTAGHLRRLGEIENSEQSGRDVAQRAIVLQQQRVPSIGLGA